MTQAPVTTKQFRYDINALRAIAVLGVVFFHYKVPFFDGGFAGVDIFFVISGYLMTKIVMAGFDKSTFSYLDFYGKRLNRIVPALLALILVLSVAGFFIYFPNDYLVNERSAASSIAFVSNILYWKTTNYFATASDENVLLHTWSLSVEWQFYMLYPVLISVLYKVFKQKKQHLLVFIISTVLFFALAVVWSRKWPTGSFYLLHTRAWEMLLGGIALLTQSYFSQFKARKVIVICGYLIIAVCFCFLRSTMSWPGVYTLLPTLATFMIIVGNVDLGFTQYKPVQFTGKISYSLYLWHWPIYVVAQYMGIGLPLNGLEIAFICLVSVLFGYTSFKLVESRRYNNNMNILAAMVVLLIATSTMSFFDLNKVVFKESSIKIAGYKEHENGKTKSLEGQGCWVSSRHTEAYNKDKCLHIDTQRKNILLLGDSHGLQFAQIFRDQLRPYNVNLLQATASGCYALLDARGEERCQTIMNYVYKDFIKHNSQKIAGIVICGNWVSSYLNADKTLKELRQTLQYLDSANIPAVVLGQNETYSMTYPMLSARDNEYNIKLSARHRTAESLAINLLLKKELGDRYVDVFNYDGVPPVVNNTPYMKDRNHLSTYGAEFAMKKILKNPSFMAIIN